MATRKPIVHNPAGAGSHEDLQAVDTLDLLADQIPLGAVVQATQAAKGALEIATAAELFAGTDTTRAVVVSELVTALNTVGVSPLKTAVAAAAAGGAATTTTLGSVELPTNAEVIAGTAAGSVGPLALGPDTLVAGLGTAGVNALNSAVATAAENSGSLAKLTAKGDLITHNGTVAVRRAVGTDGRVLVADSAHASGLNYADRNALTTKGDLLTRDSTSEVRVPVGIDGQFVMADSAQASGIIWANPTSALGPFAQATAPPHVDGKIWQNTAGAEVAGVPSGAVAYSRGGAWYVYSTTGAVATQRRITTFALLDGVGADVGMTTDAQNSEFGTWSGGVFTFAKAGNYWAHGYAQIDATNTSGGTGAISAGVFIRRNGATDLTNFKTTPGVGAGGGISNTLAVSGPLFGVLVGDVMALRAYVAEPGATGGSVVVTSQSASMSFWRI